jgi:hypothetical protein
MTSAYTVQYKQDELTHGVAYTGHPFSSNEQDPWNCVTMHQSGVVPHLLRLIGSEDEAVQVS